MTEKKDAEGKTPLVSAALYGDIEARPPPVGQRGNVNARDIFGRTPLIAATATWNGPMDCSVDIVRLLLEHGADVNAQNTKGRTALMEASQASAVRASAGDNRTAPEPQARSSSGTKVADCSGDRLIRLSLR